MSTTQAGLTAGGARADVSAKDGTGNITWASRSPGRLGFLVTGVTNAEAAARLRELRIACCLLVGAASPGMAALEKAVRDPDPAVIDRALCEFERLPTRQRRRVLAVLARVIGGRR